MKSDMPETAKWLLDRFGVAQNEALMGDLVEERGSGRSVFWFWRQTMAAIVQTVARDLWDNKMFALRAIAIGWLMDSMVWPIMGLFAARHGPPGGLVLAIFAFVVWPVIVCRVVVRTDRTHAAAMVLAYAFSAEIWLVWQFANTWPDLWLYKIGCGCLGFFFTLWGGVLSKPRGDLQEWPPRILK